MLENYLNVSIDQHYLCNYTQETVIVTSILKGHYIWVEINAEYGYDAITYEHLMSNYKLIERN